MVVSMIKDYFQDRIGVCAAVMSKNNQYVIMYEQKNHEN